MKKLENHCALRAAHSPDDKVPHSERGVARANHLGRLPERVQKAAVQAQRRHGAALGVSTARRLGRARSRRLGPVNFGRRVHGHPVRVAAHAHGAHSPRRPVTERREREANAVSAEVADAAQRVAVGLGADVAPGQKGGVGGKGEGRRDARHRTKRPAPKKDEEEQEGGGTY